MACVSGRPVFLERSARVGLIGWGGSQWFDVIVVGETRTRYRIRCDAGMPLTGGRYLNPGETALVPKHAITWTDPSTAGDSTC